MQEASSGIRKSAAKLWDSKIRVVLVRNGQESVGGLNGPKWTSSGQNGPIWTILVHFGLAKAKIQFGIRSFLSRDAACNLDLLVDSMMMSFDALLGSRLQGHECKRKTALLLAFTPLPFLFCLLYHPWPTLRTVYSCIHRQHRL